MPKWRWIRLRGQILPGNFMHIKGRTPKASKIFIRSSWRAGLKIYYDLSDRFSIFPFGIFISSLILKKWFCKIHSMRQQKMHEVLLCRSICCRPNTSQHFASECMVSRLLGLHHLIVETVIEEVTLVHHLLRIIHCILGCCKVQCVVDQ